MSIHALSFRVEFDAMTSKLLELDVGRMTFLAKQWGCVPRTILDFIDRERGNLQIEDWYRERALRAILTSGKMVLQ